MFQSLPRVKFHFCKSLFVLGLSFYCSKAQAQTPPDYARYWLSLGAGNQHQHVIRPSYHVGLAYQPAKTSFFGLGRFQVDGEYAQRYDPEELNREIGLLGGYRTGGLLAAVGVGSAWGRKRGAFLRENEGVSYYEKIQYRTVSVPYEVKYLFMTKRVGVGLGVTGTLNAQRSTIGYQLSVVAGKLR